jgi:DNA ligase-1
MQVGESVSVQGSGAKPYIITFKEGPNGPYYYCTCPAWKFIKAPIEERHCKHIMAISQSPTPTPKQTKPIDTVQQSRKRQKKDEAAYIEAALAEKWNSEDVTGYYMSEKLDGMRCLWDGHTLRTRNGNLIHAPNEMVAQLPSIALDGELFLNRGEFQTLMSIVKSHVPGPQWSKVRFMVFDAPQVSAPFQGRLDEIKKNLHSCDWVHMHKQIRCQGRDHVMTELDRILKMGGEGVMLRHPHAPYKHGRTTDLLKVKQFMDAEAYVTGYENGTGRNNGRMGALKCRDKDGITFKIGTGFPDSMRDHPPTVGTLITYKFQEKTVAGKPRFPVFVRVRID